MKKLTETYDDILNEYRTPDETIKNREMWDVINSAMEEIAKHDIENNIHDR